MAQGITIKGVTSDGQNVAVHVDSNGRLSITSYASDYATRVDDTSTPNVTYVGKATVGSNPANAVWAIKKIDETTGTVITWADGDSLANNVWNNRLGLVYS
jgi:signal recognition particle GTPase